MDNNTLSPEMKAMDATVICENSRGDEIQASLLRLSRHEVSFQIYGASDVIQMSEVLTNFRILVREQLVYSGSAVVASLINAGPVIHCQAILQDSWLEMDVLELAKHPTDLPGAFANLIQGWQKVYKILPDYKVVIADIQSFLFELHHWIDEVERGIISHNGNRAAAERGATDELVKPVTPCLNHLFEKFELACGSIAPELQPTHGLYVKRQLHPLLLCAPFMHRIYRKPLGYAGDYEMVNMILRPPYEGSSLYAKVLNSWFLSQPPAVAHRNRVKFLTRRLVEEAARTRMENRALRCYNLGCGPAQEVQDFLVQSKLSDNAQFTLLDFNEETLDYTRQMLNDVRARHNRSTRIELVKKSVGQVIKGGLRKPAAEYDVVYCAGLFDYLPDRVCQQLLNIFYDSLAPGGLLIATNVDVYNPIRNIMGYIFEWRLIERTGAQLRALMPDRGTRHDCTVIADDTGCNIFLEVRKPATS